MVPCMTTGGTATGGSGRGIEAVIFDWGGTLTQWHDVDFHAESLALAEAVRRTPTPDDDHHAHAARLVTPRP